MHLERSASITEAVYSSPGGNPPIVPEMEHQMAVSTTFGAWLRETRNRLGLDLDTLANRSCVDRSSINRIEREVSKPTLCTGVRLCKALGVDPEALVSVLQSRTLLPLTADATSPNISVLTVTDLDRFVQVLRRDTQLARSLLVDWLNELTNLYLSALETANGRASMDLRSEMAPLHFSESDVDKLLADVAFYKIEIQFPPPSDGTAIFDIFLNGGVITLRDVGSYIRWLRVEQGRSLADMDNAGIASGSALSRLETGQLEQVRLEDILSLDRILCQRGEILRMSWAACALTSSAVRQKAKPIAADDTSQSWTEREFKLALTLLAVVRWWSYFQPDDATLVLQVHHDLLKNVEAKM